MFTVRICLQRGQANVAVLLLVMNTRCIGAFPVESRAAVAMIDLKQRILYEDREDDFSKARR